VLISVTLMQGSWKELVPLSLVFKGNGKGTWKAIDPYWINLLAYEKEGSFVRQYYGGTQAICCYDGHSDEPAFVLCGAPANEWATRPDSGPGLIENPRNPCGLQLDMAWMNSNLLETKL
jgi:hypothetical protein